jgi:hypothetical protein
VISSCQGWLLRGDSILDESLYTMLWQYSFAYHLQGVCLQVNLVDNDRETLLFSPELTFEQKSTLSVFIVLYEVLRLVRKQQRGGRQERLDVTQTRISSHHAEANEKERCLLCPHDGPYDPDVDRVIGVAEAEETHEQGSPPLPGCLPGKTCILHPDRIAGVFRCG